MPDKDTILAVLQSEISLAGLLLVFAGFLLSKYASLEARYAQKFKRLVILTLIAVLMNLALSFMCVLALQGNYFANRYLLPGLELSLVVTAIVGIVGLLASL